MSELRRVEVVDVTAFATGRAGFEKLEAETFDTVVLDLMLADEDGERFLEDFKNQPRFQDVPVVVYTGKELSKKEEARLKRYAESVILKSGTSSPEKLLSDTALFLHRVDEKLPAK